MKSKKSFFSKALICNNFSRFWWTFALTTLILFLAVPLNVINQDVEYFEKYERTLRFINMYLQETGLIFVVYSVAVAAMIFRYLQNSKSVTALHSMPYTRLRLYVNNFIAGLIIVLIPLVLNLLVLLFIQAFTSYGVMLLLGDIWKWFLVSAMIAISMYSIAVMVGMFTGSTIAQILFTYILNLLPIGLIVGSGYLITGLIYGLSDLTSMRFSFTTLGKMMPLTQVIVDNWNSIRWELIIDTVLTVASVIIGYFVYRFRDLERAGDVISNKVLKPIFKYGVTTCVMALGVIYIKAIFNIYNPNVLVYVFFALVGYVIAQMLLVKSLKILKYCKGLVVYIGIIFVIAAVIKLDVAGFERRIPDFNEVEAIVLNDYGDISLKDLDYSNLTSSKNRGSTILKSEENIKNVISIHQDIIANKDANHEGYFGFRFAYKLKNGKFIVREYPVNLYRDYEEKYEEIQNTYEYKIQSYDVFNYDESKLNMVSVSNYCDSISITGEEAKELLKLAKKRILDSDYLETRDNLDVYRLEFSFSDDEELIADSLYITPYDSKKQNEAVVKYSISACVNVNKSDVELMEYLQKYISKFSYSDIEIIGVSYCGQDDYSWSTRDYEYVYSIKEDEEIIKEFYDNIDKLEYSLSDDEKYVVDIELKNGDRLYVGAFVKDNPVFSKYISNLS